jgi:hypothetical protein
MPSWCAVLGHQGRYEDLLFEARRDRLVLHELAVHEGRGRLLRQVISRLGRCLVGWGSCLQERYAGGDGGGCVCRSALPDRRWLWSGAEVSLTRAGRSVLAVAVWRGRRNSLGPPAARQRRARG